VNEREEDLYYDLIGVLARDEEEEYEEFTLL
jgi:hypothetical protein